MKMKMNALPLLVICLTVMFRGSAALDCFFELESDCTPDGPICNQWNNLYPEVDRTSGSCPIGFNKCGSASSKLSKSGTSIATSLLDCFITTGIDDGCYNLNDLKQLDPDLAKELEDAAELLGLTIDQYELCLCEGNLCNGSIRASVSLFMATSLAVIARFVALA